MTPLVSPCATICTICSSWGVSSSSESRSRRWLLSPAARSSTALVGSTPIGAPIVGALSDVAGPRCALALDAAACLAAVAIGRRTGKVANGSDLSSRW